MKQGQCDSSSSAHDKHVLMYTEQQPAQPASDSQPAHQFVIGLVTDDTRVAALKIMATMVLSVSMPPLHHQKFPLETGLVVDEHGNGLPIFEVMSASTTQLPVTEWMQSCRRFHADFFRLTDAPHASWWTMPRANQCHQVRHHFCSMCLCANSICMQYVAHCIAPLTCIGISRVCFTQPCLHFPVTCSHLCMCTFLQHNLQGSLGPGYSCLPWLLAC
ncbi:hypothetical protein ABBQ32_010591 [Trebouxia sp. C0010 RCD-2024]